MHEELSAAQIPLLAQLQKEALFTGRRKTTGTLEHPCPHKPLSGLPDGLTSVTAVDSFHFHISLGPLDLSTTWSPGAPKQPTQKKCRITFLFSL